MRTHATLLTLFILILYSVHLRAAIVIDSIVTTRSACLNSGTITVYARGSGALSYSTTGTMILPAQVSHTLSSLLAGSYDVQVTDAAHDTVVRSVTVSGNYTSMSFHPKVQYPGCRKNNSLLLICSPDSGVGKKPFLWELSAPSPLTAPQQVSDTFHIDSAGSYKIRCTDSCGNVQTRFYTVTDQTAQSNFIINAFGPQAGTYGCDSVSAGLYVQVNGDTNNIVFPFTLTVNNSYGDTAVYYQTYVPRDSFVYSATQSFSAGQFINMYTVLPHTHSNDVVYVMLTDGCGDTLSGTATAAAPHINIGQWSNYAKDSCIVSNATGIYYYMYRPNTWTLTDNATHTVVDTGIHLYDSLDYNFNNIIRLRDFTPGSQYTLTCYGPCGDSVSAQFTWPAPDTTHPYAAVFVEANTCLDSTTGLRVQFGGFSSGVTVSILSGPATAHSTKYGYEYLQTYTYPKVYHYSTIKGEIQIQDLTQGTYTYSVSDTCGHVLNGLVGIHDYDVVSMGHSLSYQKGCIDNNTIVCAMPGAASLTYYLYNIQTGQSFTQYGGAGISYLTNMPSGQWALTVQYESIGYNMTDSQICNVVHDTITIPPYINPQLTPLSVSSCGAVLYIDAIADTGKGVPPYTYDIISGPETFEEQTSSRFEVHHYGTYTVRILDACGNGTARNISIDSLTPIVVTRVARTDSCFRATVRGGIFRSDTTFSLTVTNAAGCDSIIFIDSVFVRGNHDSLPVLSAGIDTFCSQKSITISAAHVYPMYNWSNGTHGSSISVSTGGVYKLTITDAEGCQYDGSKAVAQIDSPFVSDGWVVEDSVCIDDPLEIQLSVNDPHAHYEWNVADAAQYSLQRVVKDSGAYVFTISNQCATTVYIMHAVEKQCDEHLYIPNAFTPNGDGLNDVFQVFTSYDVKLLSLKVFDRWGEKVYENSGTTGGWDGRYKGAEQPTGVYVYQLSAVWPTGTTVTKSGSLTLIR